MPIIQEMTGFQSPCAEYAEDNLSLDTYFLTNAPAMFPVEVGSTHPTLGLKKGDKLIIDRSLFPQPGDIVIAVISNEFKIATYALKDGQGHLLPFNKKVGEDELGEDFIWGVVASLHRKFRS